MIHMRFFFYGSPPPPSLSPPLPLPPSVMQRCKGGVGCDQQTDDQQRIIRGRSGRSLWLQGRQRRNEGYVEGKGVGQNRSNSALVSRELYT